MIYKSYEIEKSSLSILKKRIFLLYGENNGLKKDLREIVKKIQNKEDSNFENLSFFETDIIKNGENFYNSIFSGSLFSNNKIITILNATDKIADYIKKIIEKFPENIILILFSEILEKKSRLRKFYDSNKILIFSGLSTILIIILTFSIFTYSKNKKKISIAKNYINANIYLQNGNNVEALNILNKIIYADDPTYSSLSLFLLLNENLETDNAKILALFEHVLESNKFDGEIENLIILKKAIFETNFNDEQLILDTIKPLINEDTVWKANALMLAGNYYVSKGENLKAKEFFLKIQDILLKM